MSLKIWRADALPDSYDAAPGTVVRAQDFGIDVAAGDGALRIRELQRTGKRRMSAAEFLRGSHIPSGARFRLPAEADS